ASLLHLNLQLYRSLLFCSCCDHFLLADQNLPELTTNLFDLLLRNLRRHLGVLSLGVGDELIELCAIGGLFEELFNFLFRNLRRTSGAFLRLKEVFRDHNGTHEIELTFYLGLVSNAFSARFFSNREETTQILREVFSSRFIGSEPSAKLRRLIFSDQSHVFGRQVNRLSTTRLHLPHDESQ